MPETWQIYALQICMEQNILNLRPSPIFSKYLDFLILNDRHPNLSCGPFESAKPSSRPMSAYENSHIKRRIAKRSIFFFASAFHVKVLAVRRWKKLLRAPGGCGEGFKCVPETEVPPGFWPHSSGRIGICHCHSDPGTAHRAIWNHTSALLQNVNHKDRVASAKPL